MYVFWACLLGEGGGRGSGEKSGGGSSDLLVFYRNFFNYEKGLAQGPSGAAYPLDWRKSCAGERASSDMEQSTLERRQRSGTT